MKTKSKTYPKCNITYQRIPEINVELGKTYKFTVDTGSGKGNKVRDFAGTVMQICDRHITFKEMRFGFTESFLKYDLAGYKLMEV